MRMQCRHHPAEARALSYVIEQPQLNYYKLIINSDGFPQQCAGNNKTSKACNERDVVYLTSDTVPDDAH